VHLEKQASVFQSNNQWEHRLYTLNSKKMATVPDDRTVLNILDIKNRASKNIPKAARGEL